MSDEKVPENMLKTFIMQDGDIRLGITKDMPGHVIMHILPADVALAIPLEAAAKLHDTLCNALEAVAILEGGPKKAEEIPVDPKQWN